MDDHTKAQLTFVETASGRQVLDAKTETAVVGAVIQAVSAC